MDLDIIRVKSTEKLNELKISVDGLVFSSDLTTVTLHLKNSPTIEQRTAIVSPLVYLSDSGHSLPLIGQKMLGRVLEHTEPSCAKFFLKIYKT
jgi:hypothetical protein